MKERKRSVFGVRRILSAVFAVSFVVALLGTISAFAGANVFKIQDAKLSELSTGVTGAISTFDETNIESNVAFHKLNDSAKYIITLKNTDSKEHVIESIMDDNDNAYVSYVYDSHVGAHVGAGEDFEFVVVAKYTNAVTDKNARAQATNVKFFLQFTDIEEPEVIPITPNTGDNIILSVAILAVSATGLIVCAAIAIKHNKKSAKCLAVVIAVVAAVAVTAGVKAATIQVNSISITSSYGLYDKLVVTYEDVDGNEHEVTTGYNEPADIPDQKKDGYTFTGWEDEEGNPVDPSEPITEDAKIHPVFRANKYTIRFNGNGATSGEMADLAMTFDEAKTLPANAFANTGSTFMGWDTQANGAGVHYADQAEVKNLTAEDGAAVNLYAQWSINPYFIAYDGNGATSGEMANTNCEYGQNCTLRTNAFEKTGYDFDGWKLGEQSFTDGQIVLNLAEQGTVTLVAQWKLHIYNVTYSGLTTEEEETLRAQGNPDTYTINDSNLTLKKPADRKDADGDVREHCIGWRDVTVYPDITLPIANALGDKHYEAVWEDVDLPEYNITYDYDGGDVATANPTKHNKEQSFTLNEPTKEGYTFLGWTGTTIEGNTPVKPYTLPNPHARSDIEFTAHFRKNVYSVTFEINTDDTHVSGDMADMTGLEYDTDYNLTANAFARTGYTFGGWNRQADGQGESFEDGQEIRNLTATDGATVTLYAQWTPTQYTIVFHANNENVENPDAMAAQVVTYDVETTINPIAYTWWQHKLVEWTTNANGTGTKYADKATIKNLNANGGEIHLYAKWREIDAALQAGGIGVSRTTGRIINSVLTANPDAKRFVKYTAGTPSAEVLANAVDTSGTIDPIWLWVEGENLYWWSEDVKPRISSDLRSTDLLFSGAGTYTVDGQTKHLEYADLTGFDTSNITDYGRTFHSCGISEIDISDWDFSHATNMSEFIAWGTVKKATFPEVVDARNVTNMSLALNFGMVTDELDLSGWKTRDVKNLSNFLSGMKAEKIKFSSDFKTNNVENMASMFYGNSRLTSIEGLEYFDTTKVKNMSNMFASVSSMESLDLSTFSTAALTEMKGMFSGMSNLTSLTLGGSFKANDVTDFTGTFKNLRSLQTIDLSNLTSTPTDMSNMFESSSAAKVIDISGMDLSAVTKFTWTFISCGSLETIYVSNNPNPDNITDDGHIFLYSGPKIIGGAGSNHLGSASNNGNGGGAGQSVYARIDDPDNDKPGYFTPKNARYVRYNANIPDGETVTGETKSGYLPAGDGVAPGHLTANGYVRAGYKFMGWATSADGAKVYDDGAEITITETSKNPLPLYAVWVEKTSDIDRGLNTKFSGVNPDATELKKYSGTPDFASINDEVVVSTDNSNFPTYIWSEGDVIYYWSEADKIFLNQDSYGAFGYSKFVKLDLSGMYFDKIESMNRFFRGSDKLEEIIFPESMNTSNVTTFEAAFYGCNSLKSIDLSSFANSNVTSIQEMFHQNTGLKELNMSGWDLSNIENRGYWAPTNVETINFSNVVAHEDMSEFFKGLTKLTSINLSNIDTSNTTNMRQMFTGDTSLQSINVGSFNTSNVSNMAGMFSGCSSLSSIDVSGFDVKNVETFSGMFDGTTISTLDLSNWVTTDKLTNMYSMFGHNSALATLKLGPNFNTSKVTTMNRLFVFDTSLVEVDLSVFDTSSLQDAESMFHGATGLKTIYVSDNFTNSSITNPAQMFNTTNSLKGGAGTAWNSSMASNKDYARIDNPSDGEPGLFTDIADKPVEP